MKTFLRVTAGTILLLGSIGAFATYYSGFPNYLANDYPRIIPVWGWCLLSAVAAGAYLVALRSATSLSAQVRAASATAVGISLAVVVYSGHVAHLWVQLVLKLS